MRHVHRLPFAVAPLNAVAIAIAIAALSVAAQPAFAAGPDEPSVDIANMIQGRYNGVAGPGNQLHLVVQPHSSGPNNTFLFDVTIQGKYEERTIMLHGSVNIQREGKAARLGWVNQDNPPSRSGGRACDFPVKRVGDAFEGQTLRDQCMTALQVPTPGTWTIRIEPGTVTIKSVESGETLRFAKSPE